MSTPVTDVVLAPKGWNKPVRPAALLIVGVGVLLVWLVGMAAAFWYFYQYWEALVSLRDQPVALRLPMGMQAMAEVSSPIPSKVNLQPMLRVPIKQTMLAHLDGPVQAHVRLQTTLPVDTSVTVDQTMTVHTTLQLSAPVHAWLPRIDVTVPVTLVLPVRMTVPVKAQIPVDLDVQARAQLPPSLPIPIDAAFDVRPHIQGQINAHMKSQTMFRLVSPIEPIPVVIEQANLRVPFDLALVKQREGRDASH